MTFLLWNSSDADSKIFVLLLQLSWHKAVRKMKKRYCIMKFHRISQTSLNGEIKVQRTGVICPKSQRKLITSYSPTVPDSLVLTHGQEIFRTTVVEVLKASRIASKFK